MSTRRPELGKWLLYKWFYRDSELRATLPPTRPLTKTHINTFLQQYQSIYIKPVAGSRGKNVMRVYNQKNGTHGLHRENKIPLTFSQLSVLHQTIDRLTQGRKWIVQKDIHLSTIHSRPYDIRVMMQKDKNEKWQCTGICAKVAGPHSAVTNIAQSKGRVISVAEALKESHHYNTLQSNVVIKQLQHLSFTACNRLEAYQRYSEIGLDVGIDQQGKLWILEENTGPSHALFAHMSNKRPYQRIQRVARERRFARSKKRAYQSRRTPAFQRSAKSSSL